MLRKANHDSRDGSYVSSYPQPHHLPFLSTRPLHQTTGGRFPTRTTQIPPATAEVALSCSPFLPGAEARALAAGGVSLLAGPRAQVWGLHLDRIPPCWGPVHLWVCHVLPRRDALLPNLPLVPQMNSSQNSTDRHDGWRIDSFSCTSWCFSSSGRVFHL